MPSATLPDMKASDNSTLLIGTTLIPFCWWEQKDRIKIPQTKLFPYLPGQVTQYTSYQTLPMSVHMDTYHKVRKTVTLKQKAQGFLDLSFNKTQFYSFKQSYDYFTKQVCRNDNTSIY